MVADCGIVGATASASGLSLGGRLWLWPTGVVDGFGVAESAVPGSSLVSALPAWAEAMLVGRGLDSASALNDYLTPSLQQLADPSLMADLNAAVARLCDAIKRQERVVVWGDYDVDGVCATTVMVSFLRHLGANVSYHIPDRRADGYGLQEAGVREVAPGCDVLVTVDCGITACAEVALAQSLGCDVIVVDHHQVGDELPPAVGCLNPHRPDCSYPYTPLCAAGVAFVLLVGLRREWRQRGGFAPGAEPDLRQWLDLVALATVADMVPLTGLNRVLVAVGLRQLAQTRRPGLRALMAVAKVEPTQIAASDLGFRLGPRINAKGRLGHAGAAVGLLLSEDDDEARRLAAELDHNNQARRTLEQQTLAAAVAQVETLGLSANAALVVADEAWHPGVLGLVAGRLVQQFHRPAVVIGEGGKGSARTFESLDIHAAMQRCAESMARFGGHKAAAGLTMIPGRVGALRTAFAEAVSEVMGAPPYVPTLGIDLAVPGECGIDAQLVSMLETLGPFGQGNPEPVLGMRNVAVISQKVVGKEQEHLRLRLAAGRDGEGVDAIGFDMAKWRAQLPQRLDVVAHGEMNHFGGRARVQLRLRDLRAAESGHEQGAGDLSQIETTAR